MIGHKKNWDILLKEANNQRLSNAYLFYGISGIGKKEMALAWVSTLFSLKLPHPDLYLIAPEKTSISIDTLRNLKSSLERKAFSAPLRVVIIDEAHTMTPAAANSILKILEEPPHDLLFILIAPSLFRILPTIRSRCRKLFFSLTESEEAALNQTRQGSDEGLEKAFGVWKKMIDTQKSFQTITKTIQTWIDEEIDLSQLLELAKREKLELAKKGELAFLDQIDLISNAQRDIQRNVNKTLVMENLLVELSPSCRTPYQVRGDN